MPDTPLASHPEIKMAASKEAAGKDAAANHAVAAHQSFLSEALGFVRENIADPFVNAAVVQPVDAVAGTVNAIAGHGAGDPLLPEIKPLAVGKSGFLSPSWFCQEVSGALGMVVPYVIAGRATGGAMRSVGARLGLEGTAAAIAQDERIAQIAGAGVYGAMQQPGAGETRLGDALSNIAAFSVFETGNALSGRLALRSAGADVSENLLSRTLLLGQRLSLRAATGIAGGVSQVLVSDGVSKHQLPTSDQLIQAGIGGGVINLALPPLQSAAMRGIDSVNQRLGKGTPIDRYVKYNADLKSAVGKSGSLSELIEQNPWSSVLVKGDSGHQSGTLSAAARSEATSARSSPDSSNYSSSGASADHIANRVTVGEQTDPARLGHELGHFLQAGDARYESGFTKAAELLNQGKTEQSWQVYRSVRAAQEGSARALEAKILKELGRPVAESDNSADALASMPASGGKTYDQIWRDEFQQFQRTGGTFRPALDYGGEQLTSEESAIQRQMATNICQTLQDKGFIAVLVGGCVRDELMGRTPNDYDIATSATPDQVESAFKSLGMTVFPKGASYGVECVVIDGRTFEIATLRTDGEYKDGRRPESVQFVTSLKDDAARRDLTINAMFKDPLTGQVFDYFGGQADLSGKIIRSVGDPRLRIADDKLRMLRAPRFASRFAGFTLDPELMDAIREHAPEISAVSGERIRDELKGILTASQPVLGLQMMMNSGLMKAVLPEVYSMRGPKGRQDPTWHPEGTAWSHTKLVVGNLAGSDFEVMLGGLLHDIGKPQTQIIHADGGISNHGHDAVGADMAAGIADRLKLSGKQTEQVVDMVRLHMLMHQVQSLRPAKLQGILERPDIMNLIALEHADATGTKFPDSLSRSQREFLLSKLDQLSNAPEAQRLGAKPIVNGDILKAMNFKPGPSFKGILEATKAAQLEGVFSSEADGRRYVEEHFGQLKGLPANQQVPVEQQS